MLSARALMFEENASNSSSDRELFKLSTSPKHQHHVNIDLLSTNTLYCGTVWMVNNKFIIWSFIFPVTAITATAHTTIIPQRTFSVEYERCIASWQWQWPVQVCIGRIGRKGFQWFGNADPTSTQNLLSGASVPVKRKWLIISIRAIKFGACTQLTARQIGSITITIFGMYIYFARQAILIPHFTKPSVNLFLN